MANITIYKSDIDYASNFLVQMLRDAGFTGSLEDGTGIYDVLIKPASILYTLFKFEADKSAAHLSLAGAKRLKSTLGDTEYDIAVDEILSNWFVTRKSGKQSTGTVRVYFSRALDYISFAKGSPLFLINGVQFVPTQDYVFTASNFTSITDTLHATINFYIDVDVQSKENDGTKILAGANVVAYVDNGYYLRSEISADFVTGNTGETSTDFIARTEKAITTRELITERAISTVLLEKYDDIKSVFVARFAAPEQLRDVQTFENLTVHVGNKADIYVRAPLLKKTVTCPVLPGGILDLSAVADWVVDPVSVFSIPPSSEITPVEYPISISGPSETEYGVVGKTHVYTAVGAAQGSQVRFTYLTNAVMQSVSDFVSSDQQRVSCYDPWVKAYFPVKLNIAFAFSTSDTSFANVSAQVKSALISYVDSLNSTEPFIISKAIAAVHNSVTSTVGIRVPITVSYSTRNPLNLTTVTGAVTDQFELPAGMSDMFTWNTIQFYLDADSINLTQA